MEHFMNLVLIKNIYIGIPMAALICYLFLLFCFLNVAEKSSEVRDLKAILSALLSWTGGAVLMRLQISPGIQFWYHVSLMGLFTIPILIYDFLFHYLDIRGKDRFLYGCMAVTVSAVLLNVFTGCIPSTAGSADHGEWRYILPLSCKNRHLVAGSSRDISVSVCNAACPQKNRGTIRVSEKTRIIINRNTAHYGWKYSVRDAMER